jgi:uncharacterized protein (TIGR02217 family)
MTFPVMPALNGFSIHKRPTFATTVQTPKSGREVTNFQQYLPVWEFELVYEILRDQTQNTIPFSYFSGKTDVQQLMGLFAACSGEYGFFYFTDTSDASRTKQPLGLGDGSTQNFRLLRTITLNSLTYTEPVGGINLGESVTVFVNDVAVPESGNWTISADLTTLEFTTPPGSGATVTISFSYYYLCRFITNDAEFEEFMYGRWLQQGLRFRSILLHAAGQGSLPPWTNPLDPPIPVTPPGVLPPGKYYWEMTVDTAGRDGTAGYGVLCGVCLASTPLTGTVATAINIAQGPGGAFISARAGDSTETCPGWGSPTRMGGIPQGCPAAVGEVFGFALDTINHKLWVRNVTRTVPVGGWAGDIAGNLNGNPVTNAFGADLAVMGLVGNLFMICGASHGAGMSAGVGTVNLGQSAFVNPSLTGFVSIYSAYNAAALNAGDNSNLVLTNAGKTFNGTNVPVTFSPPIAGFSTNVGYSNAVRSNFSIQQM